jgi:GNAT superfamily N-acetyltransferase
MSEIIKSTSNQIARTFECNLRDDWPKVVCVVEAYFRSQTGEAPLTAYEKNMGTLICRPCITPKNWGLSRCLLQNWLPRDVIDTYKLDPESLAQPSLVIVSAENPNPLLISELAIKYATDFWAGAWKELIIDSDGIQYGTYDQNGEIYSNTLYMLRENQIEVVDGWEKLVCQRANSGTLLKGSKACRPFWTIESATTALTEFTTPVSENGYGGEIMVSKRDNQIVGFTAYTIAQSRLGPTLAQKRFPYQELLLADSTNIATKISLLNLINQNYPGQKIGLFLDFAIAQASRGQGLGSKLFDARISRLVDMGADVIIGRTINTSPAQYYGNYVARGMAPIAFDPANSDKAIFAVQKEYIKERK